MTIPEPDFAALTQSLLQSGVTLDQGLLMAARRHVGAAGIEQMAALERLIAACQQHTGIVAAVRQVAVLLSQVADSAAQRQLTLEVKELIVVLDDLSSLVREAFEQITYTPVQSVSAQRLEAIAAQMQRHLEGVESLILAAEESAEVPESNTPALREILGRLQARIAQIAADQRLGQLTTLGHLISQAAADLAAYSGASPAQRAEVLREMQGEFQQRRAELEKLSEQQ